MATFFKAQLLILFAALSLPATGWALTLLGVVDPLLTSNVVLPMMLLLWILSLCYPLIFHHGAPLEHRLTGIILIWTTLAIVFPIVWDLTWAIFHSWVNGATVEDRWKWYFWAYAVADTRFLNSDPLMIWVEYWSGLFGAIEIYVLYLFVSGSIHKAFTIFVAVGLMQFYGTGVFFGVEALQGFQHIRPDLPSYLKFFGLNGLWMVMPALCTFAYIHLMRQPRYDSRTVVRQLFGNGNGGTF